MFGGLYPLVQDFAQVALVCDYMYALGVTPMGFSTLMDFLHHQHCATCFVVMGVEKQSLVLLIVMIWSASLDYR